MPSHVKTLSAISISLLILAGCNNNEGGSKNINQTNEIIWLGKKGDSLGIYKSSITTTNQNNKQAWVHFPKSDDNSTTVIGKVSEFLFEINCQARSFRIIKSTNSKGIDLELGKSDWDIPAPADMFYPVVTAICSSK